VTKRHLIIATTSVILAMAISTGLILCALNTLDLEVRGVIGAVEQSR
jgi:hypothetical protein